VIDKLMEFAQIPQLKRWKTENTKRQLQKKYLKDKDVLLLKIHSRKIKVFRW